MKKLVGLLILLLISGCSERANIIFPVEPSSPEYKLISALTEESIFIKYETKEYRYGQRAENPVFSIGGVAAGEGYIAITMFSNDDTH
ncbi:hypothetical protein [Solibacillus sp. CAU 1738]|uniref:hypothetical protein n=1 Tax=Solibacillus sp. CAU 1738 TaxID=3140363 RepID=UPI0032614FCB